MKKHQLDWNPVRRGPHYCSPACGRGCTWEEWRSVNAAAMKARSLMEEPGHWTAEVHENLGWHWKLVHRSGALTLHGESGRYYASLSSTNSGLCDALWHDRKHHRNPNRAVQHRIAVARSKVKELMGVVMVRV